MDKVKETAGKLLAEFSVGFPGEYAPTGLAGLFFGVLAAFGLNGGGRDQEKLAFWFFAVIGGILVLRSAFKTLRNKNHARKLYALLVHVLVFILLDLLARFLVPMVIILVVLAVAFFFLGGGSIGAFLNGLNSLQKEQPMVEEQAAEEQAAEEQPKTEKKVSVWRMNGMMRENLKVSRDGDAYYDPEDGEWHKIKK